MTIIHTAFPQCNIRDDIDFSAMHVGTKALALFAAALVCLPVLGTLQRYYFNRHNHAHIAPMTEAICLLALGRASYA